MKKIISEFSTTVNMTQEEAQDVCKFGKGEECCIYLTVSGEGFQCVKRTTFSIALDERFRQGKMKSKGKGDWDGCAWKD